MGDVKDVQAGQIRKLHWQGPIQLVLGEINSLKTGEVPQGAWNRSSDVVVRQIPALHEHTVSIKMTPNVQQIKE